MYNLQQLLDFLDGLDEAGVSLARFSGRGSVRQHRRADFDPIIPVDMTPVNRAGALAEM